ncbi:hypothetical protein QAD02_006629 [Eretmocerus hayati]|uniref:Uncharacterized protein n=1 Tax=Eretmocerus hayati TaxID=131215 RepID=A0ACC2N1G6_9HYME|nr:hypothetical protein QAD02_006629 [Eretmocerus hayati]
MKYFEKTFKSLDQGHGFDLTMLSLKENFLNVFDQFKTVMRIKARLNEGILDDPDYFKSQADSIINNYVTENPFRHIHHIIRDDLSNYTSLLTTFIEKFQDFGNVCITRMSSLQLLNKLFEDLKMAAAQTYATLVIAYDVLDKFKSHNDAEIKARRKIRKSYIKEDIISVHHKTIVGFKDYLPQVSRTIYNCDGPGQHQNSYTPTYQEMQAFKKVFLEKCHSHQEYIGQVDPEQQCESISTVKSCSNPLESGKVCSVSRSCGKALHCENLSDTTVCLSEPLNSRRYEYYHPSNEIVMKHCDTTYYLKKKELEDYKFYGIRPHWVSSMVNTTCNPCQCICADKDYFINTVPVFSEVSRNMVITGAKLELVGDILSIKLQQGKLLPYGKIDMTSVKWLPIVINSSHLLKISWDEMRTIDLTRVILEPGYAVTGVGFRESTNGKSDKSAMLVVYSSEIDFREGRINNDNSHIENIPRRPTVELKILDPDRPTKAETNATVELGVDQFIKFTLSGADDGGQSTIPFIDTQKVVPSILTPLSGIGLYYRGQKKFSGYIGMRLITYDIVPFMLDYLDAI